MAWVPTDVKIVSFGDSWSDNMLIPEQTDAVLGENDPGVGTVVISAMGSASGQAFAYIANNLQYIRNIMVFDSVTVNVSNVAELQSALDVLDKITFIKKDVTYTISLATGTYAWPDVETRPAIDVDKISGMGQLLFTTTGAVTISGQCTVSRPLIRVRECQCSVSLPTVILSNTLASGAQALEIVRSREVFALSIDVRSVSSTTLSSAVKCQQVDYVLLGLTVNTNAPTNTNVGRAIWAVENSKVHIPSGGLTLGALTNELFKLASGSHMVLSRFDGIMPSGADMIGVSDPVDIDGTSRIVASTISSTGDGTELTPYVITIPWESAINTPTLIERTIDTLPQPLDCWVKLKLPAGTMTQAIILDGLYGGGGLILEGNTRLTTRGTTQDTIVDASAVTIEVFRCDLPVHLHSLKSDNALGTAAIHVIDSKYVKVEYCYVVSGANEGITVDGHRANAHVAETIVGTCGGGGIYAENGAVITTVNNANNGASGPAGYGQIALYSGTVYYSSGAGEYVSGTLGVSFENSGGKVFYS